LHTTEFQERQDLALLFQQEENNQMAKLVNTLNSKAHSSLVSEERLKHLYKEAGYEMPNDSFLTEEDVVDLD